MVYDEWLHRPVHIAFTIADKYLRELDMRVREMEKRSRRK